MAVRKIDFYFETPGLMPEHQQLFKYLNRLTAMQQIFMKMMPPSLAQHCALGGFSEGNLTICADNGAIATKLRQTLPSLLLKFRAMGYEVTAIRIAVQANYRDIRREKLPRKNPKIGHAGIEKLTVLAGDLPESPLKIAIESLAKTAAGERIRKKK